MPRISCDISDSLNTLIEDFDLQNRYLMNISNKSEAIRKLLLLGYKKHKEMEKEKELEKNIPKDSEKNVEMIEVEIINNDIS